MVVTDVPVATVNGRTAHVLLNSVFEILGIVCSASIVVRFNTDRRWWWWCVGDWRLPQTVTLRTSTVTRPYVTSARQHKTHVEESPGPQDPEVARSNGLRN